MVWEELVKLALIGTDRGQLSKGSKNRLQEMGIDVKNTPMTVVLEGAALFTQIRKVGLPITKRKRILPKPAAKEEQAICSPKSIQHFSLILNGNYEKALPEFLKQLRKVNKRLPEEVLPTILEKCLSERSLWSTIQYAIGNRGKWLVAQNPRWQYFGILPNQISWETGSHDERLNLLKYLRTHDTAKAIKLLQQTWQEEALNHKIDFLKTFSGQLNKGDEAFLERLLDAHRREIRQEAARLLAKMGNSALVQRMFQRLRQLIQLKSRAGKKDKLLIQLPDKCDDAMVRDGIDPRSQWFKGGMKASRLGQMITIIPPKLWEIHFNKNTTEVLDLFIHSEWGELMVQAAIEATALHENEVWTDTILTFWIENKNKQRWKQLNIRPLIEIVSKPIFNKIAARGLEQAEGLIDESDPIMLLLKNTEHVWENRLILLFSNNLKSWLKKESSGYYAGWHYRNILKKAAYLCNPALYNTLANGWPMESRVWPSWEKEVEAFLNILTFRREMIKALNK